MQRLLLAATLVVFTVPGVAFGQLSATDAERCFQNPGACASSSAPPPAATASRPVTPPDYTTVLQSPEPDRRKLQESLRTLDKYNGPIDGDLKSEASAKAITEWQKSHGYTQMGKLTPTEAVTLNNEAAKAPIRRLDPSTQTAAAAPPSNADLLKALQAKRAAARKAAEPKAEAAMQSLVKDVKAYVAADGKGAAGDQFSGFAKWYADSKNANLTIGAITPSTEDYGEAKAGAVVLGRRRDGADRQVRVLAVGVPFRKAGELIARRTLPVRSDIGLHVLHQRLHRRFRLRLGSLAGRGALGLECLEQIRVGGRSSGRCLCRGIEAPDRCLDGLVVQGHRLGRGEFAHLGVAVALLPLGDRLGRCLRLQIPVDRAVVF